jgi:hypothetical protein
MAARPLAVGTRWNLTARGYRAAPWGPATVQVEGGKWLCH